MCCGMKCNSVPHKRILCKCPSQDGIELRSKWMLFIVVERKKLDGRR
jgi:hypothetical protein